ncbi:hypothetical protein [Candidatus Palauibacter sp.]|uniref:hypothetical protein n=1 Tax=Candidatus Palauibacter sp. TaxID=3101350 RepID=UPI003B02DD0B
MENGQILGLPAGAAIALAIAIVAGIWALVRHIIKRAEWRGAVDESRRHLEGFAEWKGNVDVERKNFGEFMARIEEKITGIFDRLGTVERALGFAVTEIRSPIRLNKLGEDIAEEISAKDWAARLSTPIQSRTKGMDAYTVQQFCFAYADHTLEFSDDEQVLVNKIAFERGVEERDIRRVIGIELRNKILALRGMPLADTDQT